MLLILERSLRGASVAGLTSCGLLTSGDSAGVLAGLSTLGLSRAGALGLVATLGFCSACGLAVMASGVGELLLVLALAEFLPLLSAPLLLAAVD